MTDSHGLRVLIRIQKYNPNRSPAPSKQVFFFFFKVLRALALENANAICKVYLAF